PVPRAHETMNGTGRVLDIAADGYAAHIDAAGANVTVEGICIGRIEGDEGPVGRPHETVVAGTLAARCVNPGDFSRGSNASRKRTWVCVSSGIVSVLQLGRSIESEECPVPHSQEGVLPATIARGIGPGLAPKARVPIPPCHHTCLVYARGLNARRHAGWSIRRAHRAIKSD